MEQIQFKCVKMKKIESDSYNLTKVTLYSYDNNCYMIILEETNINDPENNTIIRFEIPDKELAYAKYNRCLNDAKQNDFKPIWGRPAGTAIHDENAALKHLKAINGGRLF